MSNQRKIDRNIFILYVIISLLVAGYLYDRRETREILRSHGNTIENLSTSIDSLFSADIEKEKILSTVLRKKAKKVSGLKIPKGFKTAEIQTVFDECKKYKIPPRIIFKLINAESSFRATAKSKVGASGYMQVMPRTYNAMHTELGLKKHNTITNLKVGIYYLSKLYKMFGDQGDDRWHLTLMSYNYGPTKVSNNVDAFLTEEFRNYAYIKKILN